MLRHAFSVTLVLCCALPIRAQAPQRAFNAPGRYEIESVSSCLVLDVSSSDRQTVQQYARNGQANQQWDIQSAGSGYVYIRSADTGKTLSLSEGSSRDGNHVIVYPQSQQLWQIVSAGSAQFQIVSQSGKALDVPNGSREAGARLQIWSPGGGENQKFRLVLVSASPDAPQFGAVSRVRWTTWRARMACIRRSASG